MILKPRDPNLTVIFKSQDPNPVVIFIITIRYTALTRSRIKYIFLVRILDEGDEAVDEDDGQLQQDEEWKQYSVDISLLEVVGLNCERFCPPSPSLYRPSKNNSGPDSTEKIAHTNQQCFN